MSGLLVNGCFVVVAAGILLGIVLRPLAFPGPGSFGSQNVLHFDSAKTIGV